MTTGNDHEEHPDTAVEEVIREVEEAEKRGDEGKDGAHSGEAGDATSPNVGAQEQAEGE
ncbi:hypothetical protein NX794_30200 [Streptomyces sp. LP11]|uniref:Uncharacterized protein n=1 Tax=Streptomyces pyxinicus TaxID=2970331 RepID=A0ABT2BA93_9ACTN|nr:hypothetical protein [Streptomyces sp. LP11]MCS0605443.1 hypothetical protein [Streptomyces sp. LP11]